MSPNSNSVPFLFTEPFLSSQTSTQNIFKGQLELVVVAHFELHLM
jgi:hypothetical protein